MTSPPSTTNECVRTSTYTWRPNDSQPSGNNKLTPKTEIAQPLINIVCIDTDDSHTLSHDDNVDFLLDLLPMIFNSIHTSALSITIMFVKWMRDVHRISRLNSSMIFRSGITTNERRRRRPCGNCSYNGTGNILTVQRGKLARGVKTMAKLDFHIFDSAQFRVNVAASSERTATGVSVTHLHLIYGIWLRFAWCVCRHKTL